ncbi:MAG: flagellar biosynthesis protein FlhB [Proteobacteria bacterium]|nr:flagellar biosynthesis protein FlhB [Pseudomonadota bacterium]
MAADDSDAEKTEQPTPKRLQEARDRGQVPRSRELGSAAVMIVGSGALLLGGGGLATGFGRLLQRGLSFDRDTLQDPSLMAHGLGVAAVEAITILLPFFAAVAAAAVIAPLALGGWVFSAEAMAPDFNRLNPVTGLGRVFGVGGLTELVKALLKLAVVGAVATWVGLWLARDATALGAMPAVPGMGRAVHLLALAMLLMSLGLVVVAAVDAPLQWWMVRRQLKMTRDEIREEYKETDGRPEVKARIRELQRKMSKRRMMQAVPTADVVVTNPTHYAVALKYDAARMKAPRVVAKGRDLVAVEIRRLADEHRVPLFEAPVLARVLYGSTEVGREIPSGLYLAVAQVLSYLYQVKTLSAQRAARLRRPVPEVDPALRERFDRSGGAE